MSKKNNTGLKYSQYDDYEEDYHPLKKTKPKKKDSFDDFELSYFFDLDTQKQRANNRYLNKKKDKNKYDNYDEWN